MSRERDICIRCGRRAVIIVCLAPPSSLVSTRHYLPSAPPNSHRSLTQMPPKPPKTNEKISLVAIEKYSRENISDKTAQIFLLSLREWRARRSKLPAEQIQQNVATVIASQPFVFWRIVPHHYQPRCHATITGASHNSPIIGRAAFRGGHPFEHRDVLAPGLACPSLDHHGLSLRGKNRSRSWCRDSAHRHHRWDKAVAKRRERGRFLGGASISVPLSASR